MKTAVLHMILAVSALFVAGEQMGRAQIPDTENMTEIRRAQLAEFEKLATQIRGDYTAVVRVLQPDGQPLSGAAWMVKLLGYTAEGTVVAQGVLSQSGIVEVANLAGHDVGLNFRGAALLPDYSFEVGGEQVGILQMYETQPGGGQILDLPNGSKKKEFTFRVPPQPGQLASDIVLEDIESSRTIRLSDLRGQVVLLDFWSVNCGACQPALDQLHKLAVRHAADWSGRVTILGANLNGIKEEARVHVQRKGWMGGAPVFLHTWCPVGAREFEVGEGAPALRTYSVRALPTMYLITPAGQIVWRKTGWGDVDIEQEIAKLLKQKG
ncbi:MAG TPA: TlpA disulfide reductase family protein [Candidatus Sumerlaeota bacterium]|nr:TlpA disulfide reductase family protein [Candidatus Sumerlaeota bacterium]